MSAAAGCDLCRNIRARWLQYLTDMNSLPGGQYKLQLHIDLIPEIIFETDNKRYYCEDLVWSGSATWPLPSPLLPKCKKRIYETTFYMTWAKRFL